MKFRPLRSSFWSNVTLALGIDLAGEKSSIMSNERKKSVLVNAPVEKNSSVNKPLDTSMSK